MNFKSRARSFSLSLSLYDMMYTFFLSSQVTQEEAERRCKFSIRSISDRLVPVSKIIYVYAAFLGFRGASGGHAARELQQQRRGHANARVAPVAPARRFLREVTGRSRGAAVKRERDLQSHPETRSERRRQQRWCNKGGKDLEGGGDPAGARGTIRALTTTLPDSINQPPPILLSASAIDGAVGAIKCAVRGRQKRRPMLAAGLTTIARAEREFANSALASGARTLSVLCFLKQQTSVSRTIARVSLAT